MKLGHWLCQVNEIDLYMARRMCIALSTDGPSIFVVPNYPNHE
jgi:hypothetical protein